MKDLRIAYTPGGAFPPLGGTPALFDASPEELRVLLCLLAAGGHTGEGDMPSLAAAAGCSQARLGSALRYWLEVGVLVEGAAPAAARPACPQALLTRESPAMTGQEVAAAVEREDMHAFLDSLQQLAGRLFNAKELETVVSLLEEMPFSQEYMLTLASYCQKKSERRRFSVRYLAQVAYTMLEKEILTVEALQAHLTALDRFEQEEWKLRRLLGIGDRRLGSREAAYLQAWTGELCYDEGVIGIAYDITVNQIGKVSLPYMDKLLRAFAAAGCRTEQDANAYLEKEREEHAAKRLATPAGRQPAKPKKAGQFQTGKSEADPTATRGSSFSGSDYMAAALRRSYGDDGTEHKT